MLIVMLLCQYLMFRPNCHWSTEVIEIQFEFFDRLPDNLYLANTCMKTKKVGQSHTLITTSTTLTRQKIKFKFSPGI